MRAFRNILRYLVSLLLMAVLILLQVGVFVQMFFLNPTFYISRLQTVDYYQEVKKEINFGLTNLSMMTSIPVEVISEPIKDDLVVELSHHSIYAAMDYMKYKTETIAQPIDIQKIENSLNAYVNHYVRQNDLQIDEDQKKQIKEVAADIAGIVSNHTELFNINGVKKFYEFQQFRRLVYLFYRYWYLAVLAFALCIAFLAALNRRRVRRTFLWSGSSMIAASLFTVIPAALALIYRIPYRLNIATLYLQNAVKAFTLGYIQYFIYSGSILCFLGMMCLFIYVRLRNQAKVRERKSGREDSVPAAGSPE